MFYMVWSEPRSGNIHDVEYKEVPLTDLEVVAERNRQRLYNRTKEHK
jgi:hypothetical protein